MKENNFQIGQEFSIKGAAHIISAIHGTNITYHYKRGGPALQISKEGLMNLIDNGTVEFQMAVSNEAQPISSKTAYLGDLPENEITQILGRAKFVEAMLEAGEPAEGTSVRAHLEATLQSTAIKAGLPAPSLATAYRWRRRYVESGERLVALKPQVDKRGNRTDRLQDEVISLINAAIEEWLPTTRPKMSWVYGILSGRIVEINATRDSNEQLEIPAFSTFVERIHKLDPVLVAMSRQGKAAAERALRSRSVSEAVTLPFQEVQFDHTPVDVMVIDDAGIPLGRPYLTVAIDKLTKVLAGQYISFTPPSFISVMRCLENVIKDKNYIADQYPSIRNDWPVSGVPITIVTDNGAEFLSSDFTKACAALKISVKTCPPGKPWFKASVERFFKTSNAGLFHNLPGTTKSSILDRGDYNPINNAVIELEILKHLFHKWVVDIYMQQPHKSIGTSPVIAWKRAAKNFPIRPLPNDIDLGIVLGKTYERAISSGRIQIENLVYASPILSVLSGTLKKGEQVVVKQNPDDMGCISVLHPKTREYFDVQAVHFEYANGLPLNVHKRLVAEQRKTMKSEIDFDSLNLAKLELARTVNAEMKKANRKTRKKAARNSGWANFAEKNGDVKGVESPLPQDVNDPNAHIHKTSPEVGNYDHLDDDLDDGFSIGSLK